MKKLALAAVVLAALVGPVGAAAGPKSLSVKQGSSAANTESVLILHGAFNYPGYWWDHTHLTAAVQAHPNADPALVDAVHQAIATWDSVLRSEFGGLITLTDVSDELTAYHKADIVVHYNPTAGGVVFGGISLCGDHKCQNVIVRTHMPTGIGGGEYPRLDMYR